MKHRTVRRREDEKAQTDSLNNLTTIDLEAMRKELTATLSQDTHRTREWIMSVDFVLGKRRERAT